MLLLLVQVFQGGALLERHESVPLGDAGAPIEDDLSPADFAELTEVVTQFPVADRPRDVSDEDFQRTRCGGGGSNSRGHDRAKGT